MSESEWTFVSKPSVPKWEEEEDSDDLKENWDDEDAPAPTPEPEKTPEKAAPAKPKKGKALKQKIAEKEAESSRPRTKEEMLADKLRNQRLQEESDLALAKEAIFGSKNTEDSSLDTIELNTRADYDAFRKSLTDKLSTYTRSPHFVPFLEELFREIVTPLDADDVKKLDTILTTIFNEKIKIQKLEQKGGKKKKKIATHTIQMERDDDYSYNQGGHDDYEDFL